MPTRIENAKRPARYPDDDGEGGDDAYDSCRYGVMEAVGTYTTTIFDDLGDEYDSGPPTMMGGMRWEV